MIIDEVKKVSADELREKLYDMVVEFSTIVTFMSGSEFKSLKSKAALNLFLSSLNSIIMMKDQIIGKDSIVDSLGNASKFVESYKNLMSANQSEVQKKSK